MPARISDTDRIDRFISTAPRDALVRLQSEVNAALKYRVFDMNLQQPEPAPAKRQRRAAREQGAIQFGEEKS